MQKNGSSKIAEPYKLYRTFNAIYNICRGQPLECPGKTILLQPLVYEDAFLCIISV